MHFAKMNVLVGDASKSKLSDPVDRYTVRLEDKVNRFLKKLKDYEAISDLVCKSPYTSDQYILCINS